MAAAITPEDIEQGFVRPLRSSVMHAPCGRPSAMKPEQAKEMARDPKSWTTCWCMVCGRRLPVEQFTWAADGEPVGS
jgi:hypothetical protein